MNSLENITKTSVLYTTARLGQPNCKIIIKYADESEVFRIVRVNDIITVSYIQPAADTYDICELKQVTGRIERISVSTDQSGEFRQFCSLKLNTSTQYNDNSIEIPVYHIRGLEIVERYVDPDTDIIVPDPVNIYTVNENNIIYIESLNKYYILEKNEEGIDELKEYDITKIPEDQKIDYINVPQVVDLSQFEHPEESEPEEPPVITPIEKPDESTEEEETPSTGDNTEETPSTGDNTEETPTDEEKDPSSEETNNKEEETPSTGDTTEDSDNTEETSKDDTSESNPTEETPSEGNLNNNPTEDIPQ